MPLHGLGAGNVQAQLRISIPLLNYQKNSLFLYSSFYEIDTSKGTFAEDGEGYVSFVDIDFTEYRRRVDNKTVRRNVRLLLS